ncbi:hypothetical protein [Castellaniella sp. UC4442_H9]
MSTREAIRRYGARVVYRAAYRHMAGFSSLASVGLSAHSIADVWRIMSLAYAQLGEADRAIDHADAQARLDEITR